MKSILLVEDDPFLIDIYTIKLKESDFKVEVVTNGQSALRKIEESNLANGQKGKKHIWPDLLLLDIVLPQTDGWEVLRKIKENPKLKNLKIIVLSNLGQKEEVEKGMKLGATKYLIKAHYTPTEVVKEIQQILRK